VFSEDSAQFARQKKRFPVIRPEDVSSRPDAQLSKASAVWTTCHTAQTLIRLKHHPSGRHGFPSGPSSVSRSFELFQLASVWTFQQPVRTTLSVRPSFRFSFQNQIWEDCCNRPNELLLKASSQFKLNRPDARSTDMEITCSRSPVRTAILLVWTHEVFIRKLLAADVRPSGQQGNTIRTRLSNRKDFQRKSQNFGRTVVRPEGL
jgi:hypothetical protein